MNATTRARVVDLTDEFIRALPFANEPAAIAKYGKTVAYTIGDSVVSGLVIKVGATTKVWQVAVRPPGREKIKRKLGEYGAKVVGKDEKGVERTATLNVKLARHTANNAIPLLRKGIDPFAKQRQEIAKRIDDRKETLLWLLSRRLRGWQNGTLDTRASIAAFIADKANGVDKHDAADMRAIMKHLNDWLDLPLREIDWRMVATRFTEISAMKNKRGEPMRASVNRMFRNLSSMFNGWLSHHRGEAGLENPVNILSKRDKRADVTFHPPVKRTGWISTMDEGTELVAWWRAVQAESNETARDYLLVTLLQGARSIETATLEWRHLDFAKGVVTYEKTKNGENYHFPMTPYVRAILERRRDDEDNRHERWVFPAARPRYAGDPINHISPGAPDTVDGVRQTEGVPYWQMHDLRRTYRRTLYGIVMPEGMMDWLMKHALAGAKGNYDKFEILAPGVFLQYEQRLLELVKKANERDQLPG